MERDMSKTILAGITLAAVGAFGMAIGSLAVGDIGPRASLYGAAGGRMARSVDDPRVVAGAERLPLARAGAGRQAAPPCTDPEHHRLDFWIGDWRVTDPGGEPIGASRVRAAFGHCAIREEWDSGAVRGGSVSTYDQPERTWRQMWVDDHGGVLRLSGAWKEDRMVMTGWRVGSDGRRRLIRLTLSPADDGSVRQRMERSEDEGRTWTVVFRGTYHRRPGSVTPK
jgi:hypothetical protein